MIDKITIQRIGTLHPDVREEVKKMFNEINAALTGKAICRISQAFRTFPEQQALYEQGRSRKGNIVTWAAAGKSWHNYGLAFDIVLLIKPEGSTKYSQVSYNTKEDYDGDNVADWEEVTKICLKYGWKYLTDKNGRRYDYPHFQKTFGFTISQMLEKYKIEGIYPKLK